MSIRKRASVRDTWRGVVRARYGRTSLIKTVHDSNIRNGHLYTTDILVLKNEYTVQRILTAFIVSSSSPQPSPPRHGRKYNRARL